MIALTSTVKAQRTPVINHTEHRQMKRINQGTRSGELTRSESVNLRMREQRIRADKHMAKADGRLTLRERANLRHREARLSKAIYRKKHNRRVY
jgi:ribosomal protein S2